MDSSKGRNEGLLSLNNYYVITFPNTHSAIKAEKLLEKSLLSFLIMPVPRVISSGCGLAIKTSPDNYNEVIAVLKAGGVSIQGAYAADRRVGSFVKM